MTYIEWQTVSVVILYSLDGHDAGDDDHDGDDDGVIDEDDNYEMAMLIARYEAVLCLWLKSFFRRSALRYCC